MVRPAGGPTAHPSLSPGSLHLLHCTQNRAVMEPGDRDTRPVSWPAVMCSAVSKMAAWDRSEGPDGSECKHLCSSHALTVVSLGE